MVFGKVDVEEPSYEVLLSRTVDAKVPYDIRSYGKRFAIETEYASNASNNKDMMKETRSPFMTLAGYIGVMKEPENEGSQPIAMTAPVAMSKNSNPSVQKKEGEKIAMTAPVVMEGGSTDDSGGNKNESTNKMQFILPSKYDDMDKIPRPTNDAVRIKQLEPSVGAVHTFTGSFNEEIYTKKAMELAEQLRDDGIKTMTDEEARNKFQFWGYNPPFTIPFLRRNEIWIEISQQNVEFLRRKYETETHSSFSNAEEKMDEI